MPKVAEPRRQFRVDRAVSLGLVRRNPERGDRHELLTIRIVHVQCRFFAMQCGHDLLNHVVCDPIAIRYDLQQGKGRAHQCHRIGVDDLVLPRPNRWSGLLEAACGAAWANDSYKREHAPQVSKLAVRLAQELGQNDEDQLELIHLAALLQDIGEFQVPRRIREKKGKLRASERRCVQQHSRASAEVLGKAADTERIAEIILHHHEHYDGTGYPEGLAGEKIPIESRILAVADAYVAMTSNRSYRKAMSDTQAIAEIVASAGTQFDRVVVDALLGCHAADTLARVESRSNEPLAAAGFTRA